MSENHEYPGPFPDSSRLSLQADCDNCFGLCCVALPFAASADFAIDKDARAALPKPAIGLPLRRSQQPQAAGLSRLHCL